MNDLAANYDKLADDFDEAIINHMKKTYNMAIGEQMDKRQVAVRVVQRQQAVDQKRADGEGHAQGHHRHGVSRGPCTRNGI